VRGIPAEWAGVVEPILSFTYTREFFDVNPGKRRGGRPSRFRHHVRLSFGAPRDVLERAVVRLAEIGKE